MIRSTGLSEDVVEELNSLSYKDLNRYLDTRVKGRIIQSDDFDLRIYDYVL